MGKKAQARHFQHISLCICGQLMVQLKSAFHLVLFVILDFRYLAIVLFDAFASSCLASSWQPARREGMVSPIDTDPRI